MKTHNIEQMLQLIATELLELKPHVNLNALGSIDCTLSIMLRKYFSKKFNAR